MQVPRGKETPPRGAGLVVVAWGETPETPVGEITYPIYIYIYNYIYIYIYPGSPRPNKEWSLG